MGLILLIILYFYTRELYSTSRERYDNHPNIPCGERSYNTHTLDASNKVPMNELRATLAIDIWNSMNI